MWQLMNIRYVVDKRDISNDGLSLVYAEDGSMIFEMGDPFPRAWLVGATEVIPEDSQAIARLASDEFDLRQTAILANQLDAALDETTSSTVSVVGFSPTGLTTAVNATGDHLLVFSHIYYPGWRAFIDDNPAHLWRVNVVQSGVVLPAGSHTVRLTYWPDTFRWGGIISIIGIVVWGALLLWPRRSGTKKP